MYKSNSKANFNLCGQDLNYFRYKMFDKIIRRNIWRKKNWTDRKIQCKNRVQKIKIYEYDFFFCYDFFDQILKLISRLNK